MSLTMAWLSWEIGGEFLDFIIQNPGQSAAAHSTVMTGRPILFAVSNLGECTCSLNSWTIPLQTHALYLELTSHTFTHFLDMFSFLSTHGLHVVLGEL